MPSTSISDRIPNYSIEAEYMKKLTIILSLITSTVLSTGAIANDTKVSAEEMLKKEVQSQLQTLIQADVKLAFKAENLAPKIKLAKLDNPIIISKNDNDQNKQAKKQLAD